MRQLAYKALKVCSEAERASLEGGVEPPELLDRVIVLPRRAAVEANDEAPPAHQTTPLGAVVLRNRAKYLWMIRLSKRLEHEGRLAKKCWRTSGCEQWRVLPITDPDFIACAIEVESRPSRKALVGFQGRFQSVVKEVIAPDD